MVNNVTIFSKIIAMEIMYHDYWKEIQKIQNTIFLAHNSQRN